MPPWLSRITRPLLVATLLLAGAAQADDASKHLAPGFSTRAAGSKLVVVPADMELYSISAGGVVEPRADWTDAAQKNFVQALEGERKLLGPDVSRLEPAAADEMFD